MLLGIAEHLNLLQAVFDERGSEDVFQLLWRTCANVGWIAHWMVEHWISSGLKSDDSYDVTVAEVDVVDSGCHFFST